MMKGNGKEEQGQEQEEERQPTQCGVLVQFDAPGSSNLQMQLIGQLSPPQLLLAAAYLRLVADKEVHSAWMAQAQRRAAERAQLEQVKQMVRKAGDDGKRREQ
jgi:hypothetical protein